MTMTMQGHKPYRRPNINENYIQLTGTEIHMFRVPGTETVVLTLATSGGGNRSNYPKFTWYGELASEVEETVSIGDRVSVIATVQTKRFERKGERPIYRQNLVGNGITPALKKIESTFGWMWTRESMWMMRTKSAWAERRCISSKCLVRLFITDLEKTQ